MKDSSIIAWAGAQFHSTRGQSAARALGVMMLAVAVVVGKISWRLAGLPGDACSEPQACPGRRHEKVKPSGVPQVVEPLREKTPKELVKAEEIAAWTEANLQLGDKRRSRALGEMVWGLIQAGVVAFAAIGRKMAGPAEEASNIKKAFRWCHNKLVDVAAVQQTLIRLLVPRAALNVEGLGQVAVVAIDWHSYDHGDVSGLRVSLMTGSRALPLLWYEFKSSELKDRMHEIELRVLQDLLRYRPEGVKWLTLLDAGFKHPELLDLLEKAGFYVVRSGSKLVVHSGRACWTNIGNLPVATGQIVEFGWLYWNRKNPRRVRLVSARLYDIKPRKRGRRTRQAGRYKSRQPGLCPVITNLPFEACSAVVVIRLYARRFEIEHSFRDIKNSTLGMDMEHVHLLEATTYSRLMCIVALAETTLWLAGSEVETRGLHRRLTPSCPKDGHRVLSLRNAGFLGLKYIELSMNQLLDTHLAAATSRLLSVVGRTWQDVKQRLTLKELACCPENVLPLQLNERRKDRRHMKCNSSAGWPLESDAHPMAA